MVAMRGPRPFSCDSGTTAVEFALVGPPFLMLLVGIMYASFVVFCGEHALCGGRGGALLFSKCQQCHDGAELCPKSLFRRKQSHVHGFHPILRPSSQRHAQSRAQLGHGKMDCALDRATITLT